MGRNRTSRRAVSAARPPTRPAAGAPTVHVPGGWPARAPAALQTTKTTTDRRPAKQYWPIRRVSIMKCSILLWVRWRTLFTIVSLGAPCLTGNNESVFGFARMSPSRGSFTWSWHLAVRRQRDCAATNWHQCSPVYSATFALSMKMNYKIQKLV